MKSFISESEIKYILGESHKHKLKDIMNSPEIIYEKPIPTESKDEEEETEKTESMQQSLFDF